MRNVVTDLKEKLEDGLVESYSWLETKDMVADVLTKECKNNGDVDDILIDNVWKNVKNEDNLVSCMNGEIQLRNVVSKRM